MKQKRQAIEKQTNLLLDGLLPEIATLVRGGHLPADYALVLQCLTRYGQARVIRAIANLDALPGLSDFERSFVRPVYEAEQRSVSIFEVPDGEKEDLPGLRQPDDRAG